MAKNIFEELPARKHAPAKAAPAAAKGGDDKGGREGGDGSCLLYTSPSPRD